MENRKHPIRKSILILFPHNDLCAQIVRLFAENNFSVSAVLFEDKLQSHFGDSEKRVATISLDSSTGRSWDNLTAEAKTNLLSVPIVLYCADKDFLKMKTTGREEEWSIDFQNEVQQRFAFINHLLNQFSQGYPKLWMNLALGTRAPDRETEAYCKTRYGMIGFSKAIQLNPRFKGIDVQNICLSFFRFYQNHRTAEYCTYCTTPQQRQSLMNLTGEDELLQYLINESEKLFQ
ncbi:MAG: hypothetical protein GXO76_10705 [Calditrichaeota bacterium]|nr:hypothetical protein [Calditrichota bacterium]